MLGVPVAGAGIINRLLSNDPVPAKFLTINITTPQAADYLQMGKAQFLPRLPGRIDFSQLILLLRVVLLTRVASVIIILSQASIVNGPVYTYNMET